MKRILATIFLSFAVFGLAYGQEIVEETIDTTTVVQVFPSFPEEAPAPYIPDFNRNEIDVSLTLGSGLQIVGAYASLIISILGSAIKDEFFVAVPFFVPSLSLEYDRWLNEKIAVGASINADVLSALPTALVANVSVMPDFKYRWLHRDKVSLYSKVALGYLNTIYASRDEEGKMVYGSLTGQYAQMLEEDFASAFWTAMIIPPIGWQVTPIGMDIITSARNLYFYMELGVGTQGAFTFGLKKTF